MTPQEFVKELLPYAEECEKETGINAYVILAQAALESGWGRYCPGNMYFGVKDVDGINGNEQLVLTTEYSRRANCTPKELGLVDIQYVEPIVVTGRNFFKYRGHAYFRKFDSPKDSFVQHAELFKKPIYAEAYKHRGDPEKFIELMSKHYATAPNYAEILTYIYHQIKKA